MKGMIKYQIMFKVEELLNIMVWYKENGCLTEEYVEDFNLMKEDLETEDFYVNEIGNLYESHLFIDMVERYIEFDSITIELYYIHKMISGVFLCSDI